MTYEASTGMKRRMLFLHKFFRMPQKIGSVTPSSVYLAKKMVEYVPWYETQYLAELGSGTGAITKFITLARKESSHILLFEQDLELKAQLDRQYPEYSSYADACQLEGAMRSEGITQLDCILSSLPFFNFPQPLRDRLLEQIVSALKPGGRLIAFQYSLQMKEQFSRHFAIDHIEFVPFNLPPAFVYVCRKKKEPDRGL